MKKLYPAIFLMALIALPAIGLAGSHEYSKSVSETAGGKDIVDTAVSAGSFDTLVQAISENGLMVDQANVTKADIEASNGVIHVIDRVILPG